MATDLELVMFQSSHFNEKVRWALDYKEIPHRRTSLLPGPHVRTVTKLTGQAQVPVLVSDGEPLHGSARIIDALEKAHPEPALYPEDPEARSRALEIQQYFDDEVGPNIRRALFFVMVEEPGYLTRIFARAHPAPVRILYRCVLPLVKGKMVREMQIEEPYASEALKVTEAGFDFVARESGASGYLVGDRFSVADLAAAALLAPGVELDHPDMRKPTDTPPSIRAWLDRWRDHPGAEWVRDVYARHRPQRPPCADDRAALA
jgi:glutathione S-transferase